MKILFLNSAPIIKYGLKIGFEKNGWETEMILFPEEATIEGFKKKLDEFKPDYVLMEGGINADSWVFPVVEEFGLKMIYWGIEDPVWIDTLSQDWGKRSVLVATPCIEAIPKYEQNGIKAICVPFAIDPSVHNNKGSNPKYKDLDAIFIGNNYNYYDTRYEAYQIIIQPFINLGRNIEIYGGPEWVNPQFRYHVPNEVYKGYMPMEETLHAYSNVKFVLGVHSVVDSTTMQSMRTFEVLGCGGFFLTSRTKAIESMFVNHKHLVASSSVEETYELINYYLYNEDKRKKIALEGQKLVYEKHTYEQRARDIIRALNEI